MSHTIVSLPRHLRDTLEPLPDILPEDLRLRLSPYLTDSTNEIPYSILLNISKWARTDNARSQLRARDLEQSHYSIIALLAGTITSPSSKLPPYIPPEDASKVAKRSANDRQAITMIMNALLSIGGSGYAGWWASGRTSWRNEWVSGCFSTFLPSQCRYMLQRVLFALLVASVVAISEALLYLIWQFQRDKSRHRHAQLKAQKRRKKQEDSGEDKVEQEGEHVLEGLRKRRAGIMIE